MVSHYRDVRIIDQEDLPTPVIMSQLFEKLHHGLVPESSRRIAVSFPEIGVTLGSLLRLHGTADDLQSFGLDWVGRLLIRMVRCGGVFTAPPEASSKVFRRVQPRAGGERWLRRWEKRHGDELPRQVPKAERISAPFAQIRSKSTGHTLRLFIVMDDPKQDRDRPNSYGLGCPVPLF